MDKSKIDIWVYAHWVGMRDAKCIGILSAHFGKGRKSFSFEYDSEWISSKEQLLLDPDLGWYSGKQFPNGKDLNVVNTTGFYIESGIFNH